MINKFLQDALDEFCRPTLIEGQLYAFKLNGYMCSGIYLDADDDNSEGSFYCNGKPVCKVSEADQIKHMIDSAIYSSHMMYRHFDEALLREVMFIVRNAMENELNEGTSLQPEDINNLNRAHEAIYTRLVQAGETHDSLQAPYPQLSAPAQSVVVLLPQDEEVKINEHILRNIIVDRVTIPWDVGQSIKSIERRIKAAIEFRDFAKAERLNNVSIAIRNVHNYCPELLNATR
ncbi:hypothetical protein [Vibrio cholerae]|uniref:hypothetical protein n=1 Tax=Vibrio cholerae TaxID=666 RepID=UPI002FDC44D6